LGKYDFTLSAHLPVFSIFFFLSPGPPCRVFLGVIGPAPVLFFCSRFSLFWICRASPPDRPFSRVALSVAFLEPPWLSSFPSVFPSGHASPLAVLVLRHCDPFPPKSFGFSLFAGGCLATALPSVFFPPFFVRSLYARFLGPGPP